MYNWLGQKIEVGTVVGRGARDGNSSTFKIGVVDQVDEIKDKARVQWKYDSTKVANTIKNPIGTYMHFDYEHLGYGPTEYWVGGSKGWCTPESLFVLDSELLDRAEKLVEIVKEARERNDHGDGPFPMSPKEWLDRVSQV
jgi:hypothetical protein